MSVPPGSSRPTMTFRCDILIRGASPLELPNTVARVFLRSALRFRHCHRTSTSAVFAGDDGMFQEDAVAATDTLLRPETCAMLLVDFQAGLGFGVESASRQVLLNNAVALARTAAAFDVPVVVSTSASHVYSGPLLPAIQDVLPAVKAIERKPMNVWEDDVARTAVVATGRRRLILAGFLTEACVSFSALSALDEGFDVFIAGDTCGGITLVSHDLALRRWVHARVGLL